MITPNDVKQLSINRAKIDELVKEVDQSIKDFHGDYPWEYAILMGEYQNEVMDALLGKYFDAGWKYIFWQRSSENSERPGLTGIMLSTSKIDAKYVANKHQYVRV
ncbi:MAG: hypothetical protein BWY21_02345 [Parcubacteria group bacterium ADurb.Bin216]|nr:MAG: hypothetical protein BWY21_02345 [Parcubacteria group bacterium ADurb.Bin216]